jgi:hypothetical protein
LGNQLATRFCCCQTCVETLRAKLWIVEDGTKIVSRVAKKSRQNHVNRGRG